MARFRRTRMYETVFSPLLFLCRVAFLAFIMDSQHAMIFGHSLILHAQEMNIVLPCKEDVWSSGSANEWQRAMIRNNSSDSENDQVKFIDIVKMFMNEPSSVREQIELDPFGSFILLHGLISVKWHLQHKANGSGIPRLILLILGIGTNNQSRANSPQPRSGKEPNWKINVERGLNAWRSSIQGSFTAHSSTSKFNKASLVLYRIANITLNTNILDLQVLAGLSRLMGKPVKSPHCLWSLVRLSVSWAPSDGALKAVQHSLKLLQENLFIANDYQIRYSNQSKDNLQGILHGKWCLYLATLTLWAWGAVTTADEYPAEEPTDSERALKNVEIPDVFACWLHAQQYLEAMLNVPQDQLKALRTIPQRADTRGLVGYMYNILISERWELCIFFLRTS
jgi:hypothetical protein